MSDSYVLHQALPQLDRPVLVVMLTGWIDASAAAAAAMVVVQEECNTEALATFDGDAFIDYRARRPSMELREGVSTKLTFPDIELRVGKDPGGNDVLTLSGPEPDSQWRRFAAAVGDLSEQLAVRRMVALGAYPFAAPHTRPARLSSTSPSAQVSASVPYLKNSVDVPAGMGAVLEHELHGRGITALGLWAQVPHYVSSMSYPDASVALLTGLREMAGLEIDGAATRTEAERQRRRLDQLVAGNEEHQGMVRQLEELYDTSAQQTLSLGIADIPSGDQIAAEFEAFLRDQDD